MGFASLCCVPLIPLRGMRSSQVDIEVFDGWTRREMERFNKVVSDTSPPALFDSLTPVDKLTTPLKKLTYADMINKAKIAADAKANVKLSLDQTQEESYVGAGDSPRYVDLGVKETRADTYQNIRVSRSDTQLSPLTNTGLNIKASLSDTNLYLNVPVSCSDIQFNLKAENDLNIPVSQSDLKSEDDLKAKKSFKQRVRSVVQRLSLKRKGQKEIDVEKIIQDSAKFCKDAQVEGVQKDINVIQHCHNAQVEEVAKKVFQPYLMDQEFAEIRSYRRSDVVYGSHNVVRKFGEMLLDLNVDDIKRYRGCFLKVSTIAKVY